jgi:hypothetical protein
MSGDFSEVVIDDRPHHPRTELHTLTSLRFCAAVAVFIAHAAGLLITVHPQHGNFHWMLTRMQEGRAGVAFFFCFIRIHFDLQLSRKLEQCNEALSVLVGTIRAYLPIAYINFSTCSCTVCLCTQRLEPNLVIRDWDCSYSTIASVVASGWRQIRYRIQWTLVDPLGRSILLLELSTLDRRSGPFSQAILETSSDDYCRMARSGWRAAVVGNPQLR